MAEKKMTVCSVQSAAQMIKIVQEEFDKNRFTVYKWRSGQLTSLPQLALIHIWLRTWVAFVYKKPEDTVTQNEIESMKRSVKARYYHETGDEFMVEQLIDPLSPDKKRMEYTSIADWDHGECFAVMEWMQDKAAENGLILESTGEYAKNKKAQHNR